MEINQIQIPEKKKISIATILEEAWELYIYTMPLFWIYLILWLIVVLLATVFIDLIPFLITSYRQGYATDNASVHPYSKIIEFIALTFFLSAFMRAIILRYEGEEHKYGKVMKQAAMGYFKYFFVMLSYTSICLLGFKSITDPYWLNFIIDEWIRNGIRFALLIPVFYLIVRYFPCLTLAITNPSGSSAFKTSATLMKNNYCSGILIILLISSMIYFLFSIGKMFDIIIVSELIASFGSLFVLTINFIYCKKLEAIKGIPADAPELRKVHPVIGLLLAVVVSLIPLSILFPHIPQKIFYSNDFFVGAFSRKIIFDNGIIIKRPAGWYVEIRPGWDGRADYYYLTKPGNKIINDIILKLRPLNNRRFRKDKLNPEELNQLKDMLLHLDTFDKCAYKITDTIQEMNNQLEYPKGSLMCKRSKEKKEYSYERSDIDFYRVVDNKYLLVGSYVYMIQNSHYYRTPPDALSALPKEREEADAYLKHWVCGINSQQ